MKRWNNSSMGPAFSPMSIGKNIAVAMPPPAPLKRKPIKACLDCGCNMGKVHGGKKRCSPCDDINRQKRQLKHYHAVKAPKERAERQARQARRQDLKTKQEAIKARLKALNAYHKVSDW